MKGIDVSVFQREIDWQKVKESGVEFAILRACYGWDREEQIDRYFYRNVEGAKAAGIPIGAYHYSYAQSEADAVKEADFFLRVIKGIRFEMPVWFDLEDKSQMNLGREKLTGIAKAFCSTVESAGYYVGIYSNLDWLTNRLDMSRLPYDLWLAQWASSPSYTGSFGIWQYSAKGNVPGIVGNVDMNVAYKDYPAIIQNAGLNGWSAQKPVPQPDPAPDYEALYHEAAAERDALANKYGALAMDVLALADRLKEDVQDED